MRQRLAGRAAELGADYWWLWSAVLVAWTARFVGPFLTLYLTQEIGMSSVQSGTIMAVYGAGMVLSALIGGALTDALGRKTTLLGSFVGLAVFSIVLCFARTMPTLIPTVFTLGLVTQSSQPPVSALIADMLPDRLRNTGFALNIWAMNFGWAVGPLFAGSLADRGYALVFVTEAVAAVLAGAVVLFKVKDRYTVAGRSTTAESGRLKAFSETLSRTFDLRVALRDRTFMWFAAMMMLIQLIYSQCTTTLPIVMTDDGFSASDYGRMISLNGWLMILFQIPVASALTRFARSSVLAVAAVVFGIGFGLTFLASTLLMYAMTVAIWSVAEMMNHPVAYAATADLATIEQRGRYLGLQGVATAIGGLIGPIMGGAVLDGLGSDAVWGMCFIIGLVCGAGRWFSRRGLEARLSRPSSALSQQLAVSNVG